MTQSLQEEIIRLLVCRYAPAFRTVFSLLLEKSSFEISRVHLDN
jgi:hypothetical protein